MRLVAWNCNYNNRRRSLEENVRLLKQLHADLLVLSEVAPPGDDNPLGAHWVGANGPGLAVVVRANLRLIAHPTNVDAPSLMCGYTVRGPLEFALLAVWPVQVKGGPSYHETLMAGLERYASLLNSHRAIMAGDFNSNTRVSNQQRTHSEFVQAADQLGLVSAYHFQSGETHGDETIPTYVHGSGETGEFHLDYCFVAKALAESANLSVLRGGEWPNRSDHFPVVMDLPNAALAGEPL